MKIWVHEKQTKSIMYKMTFAYAIQQLLESEKYNDQEQ
jgi:hypothetical protein